MMADERDHVRVIRTSSARSEIARSRHEEFDYHNTRKDTRKGSSHGYSGHRELKRKGDSKRSFVEKRNVIDRDFDDEPPEKLRSRVEIVRKPIGEKPLLITVRNDIEDSETRYYHKGQHDGRHEYSSRRRSNDGELHVRDRGMKEQERTLISNDESSDVDSDYTIEMRSHQGSDDAKSDDGGGDDDDGGGGGGDDDDDDDSVYSVEFKNIGGSDEDDDECEKNYESKEANEDDVGERIFEDSVANEDSFQTLAVEGKDIETARNDAASPEFSEDGEGTRDQERTVVLRKSGAYDVNSKKTISSDTVNKDESTVKENGGSKVSTEGVSMLSVSEEVDFAKNQRLLEVSGKRPVDKVVREIEIKHIDSKRNTKETPKTNDNKGGSIEEKGLVGEVGADKQDIVSDKKVDRDGDGKIKSKGVFREEDRMKSKMSKEKKLLEEIKLLEEKLGKEQAKKTPEKESVIDHFDRKGPIRSDGSKNQSSKSEKVTGGGSASGKESMVVGGKRIENKELASSKNVKIGKPSENSLVSGNLETIDRSLSGRSPGGKSSSAKEAADKVIKEQAGNNTGAVPEIQMTAKKPKQEIKGGNVKETLDKRQAQSATNSKRKSSPTDAKARIPNDKKNQDTVDKNRIENYGKKSQKVKTHATHKHISESSSSTDSNTSSSSSSSSSDQSGSESETDSSKSGSRSAKSGSEKSSDSESNSSSESSQSSLSDSESSSSEEENFKRKRRQSTDPKAVRKDVRQRHSSPRREKEAGYISPLRTKKSEWGTKRHEDQSRLTKTDERFRKKSERLGRDQSYNQSGGQSKDRPRQRTRSRSRGKNQGRSQRRTRSKDRMDSKARKGPKDFTEKRTRMDSRDRTSTVIGKDSRDRTDMRARRDFRDRTDTRARRDSRDRTDTKARRESRDRTDVASHMDSRDRSHANMRRNSRDRMDARPRKDSRDRTGTGVHKDSRDATNTKVRKNSRDRVGTRTRKDSRDRTDSRTYVNPRDRTDIRDHRESRDLKHSRNEKNPQDRVNDSRYLGDGKQDGSNSQSKKDTLDDRKGAAYRKRSEDRGQDSKLSAKVSGKGSQDNADSRPKDKNLEKSSAKSELSAQKTRNPQEITEKIDAVKRKPVPERERSPCHGKPGSRDDEKKSDNGKAISSSNPSTTDSLMATESKKPRSLMELDVRGAKVDVGKVSSKLALEPQSKVSRQRQAGKNKDSQSKHEIEDEPKPLMEITLSAVTQPTSKPESRQLRKVSMSGSSGSIVAKESKSQQVDTKRRQVLRVDRLPSTDAELSYNKGNDVRNGTSKKRSNDGKAPKSRVYLKRLSSGKEVYLENRDIEPLMKPVDFDMEVLKKPRIVENISDESGDHRSIRRVISNSSSDVPQIQLAADGFQPQAKRKVFSRLGRNITKSKNISINLKTTVVQEDTEGVPTVKTENEIELDERIKNIRERNAEILRRQKEIEEDIKLNS